MSHAPHHAGLEVVPGTEMTPKYLCYAAEHNAPEASVQHDVDTQKIAYTNNVYEHKEVSKICGLRRRTAWIALIVATVVVLAAVGGGVGAALASRNSNDTSTSNANKVDAPASEPPAVSSIWTSAPTPTPTATESSTTITTTSIVGPSSTLFRDCPSSNDTLYDVVTGETKMTFRKECSISFVNANGIQSNFGKPVNSLNDCIDLCAAYNISNKTQIAAGTNRICNSVCWRNTFDKINDWPGGMCFGFTSQNSSGTFRYRTPAETRCDSAALINQEY
ncbi:hypothetical protein BDU57DRAFT_210898 [Ampelomyces quisqualis]|uniref:Apple domain-containing protein n=1 Tax=Ampelomyces quisqualis TaxID=50730 RepID=A0A6A5QME0_AMPQU|nr:hypothetical protein BDU57DRAFT_210898 [Ampelomyces quisqualis]